MSEHRRAVRQGDIEDSALAEHAWTNHNPVDWTGTQVCSMDWT